MNNKVILNILMCFLTLNVFAEKPGSSFKLIFFDDFNGNKLNHKYWSIIDRKHKKWGVEEIKNADFLNVKNGVLTISSYDTKDKNSKDSLVIGGVTTQKKVFVKYGKIEIRAKLTENYGLNSSIWLLADSPKYGKGNTDFQINKHYNGEIDLLERVNNEAYARCNIHTYNTAKKIDQNPFKKTHLNVTQYHIYSVILYEDSVVLFIDGKKILTYKKKKKVKFEQYPFDQAYYLMIEFITDGWTGKVKKEYLPAKIIVDWVKFYKLTK